jgi:hypothetical protein
MSPAHNRRVVRRLAAIILLVGFAALGTGLLEGVHLRTHLIEQAQARAAHPDQHHPQSADDCELCAQLHLPVMSRGWVPMLVCLGLLVAFLTLLAPALTPQRVLLRLDCRGPPVL